MNGYPGLRLALLGLLRGSTEPHKPSEHRKKRPRCVEGYAALAMPRGASVALLCSALLGDASKSVESVGR